MNAEREILDSAEAKRSGILEYSNRIIALIKQGHLDLDAQRHAEIELSRALSILVGAHTEAYRNANNNLLKKWDLNA